MKHRDAAPAYQEYASDMLGNRNFKTMTLAERGLLYTLRMDCWVNRSVPTDPTELAHYLGIQVDQLRNVLTKRVLDFTEAIDDEMVFPDLEEYRDKLTKAREGRRQGAKMTNDKLGRGRQTRTPANTSSEAPSVSPSETPTASAAVTAPDTLSDTPLRGVEMRGVEVQREERKNGFPKSAPSLSKEHQEWKESYEVEERKCSQASNHAGLQAASARASGRQT